MLLKRGPHPFCPCPMVPLKRRGQPVGRTDQRRGSVTSRNLPKSHRQVGVPLTRGALSCLSRPPCNSKDRHLSCFILSPPKLEGHFHKGTRAALLRKRAFMTSYNHSQLCLHFNVRWQGKRQDMQLYIWHDHNSIKQKLFMQKLEGNSKNVNRDCLEVVALWVVHFFLLLIFQAVYKEHLLLIRPGLNFILQ